MSWADRYNQECCEECTSCYYYWQNNDTENECLGEDETFHGYIKSKYTKEQNEN